MAQIQPDPEDFDNDEVLAQDFDKPFSEPSGLPRHTNLPPDHPSTDTNIDEHEAYDEGTTGASEVYGQHEEDTL